VARVLVVEDEPNISGIIVFKLEREGHEVHAVTTAGAALSTDFAPDVVLLDSSLDDADGVELVPRFTCPVIVMTEFRDERSPERALALGATRTIGKPFKPTVLARVVSEVASGG
jgi:DNA-binding response OmpR family regulator